MNVSLADIHVPVYKRGTTKPMTEDKVIFFLMGKDTEYSDAEYVLLIVDDKNKPGESLAERRLGLLADGVQLFSLKRAIFFLGDLIKLAKSRTWFIDASGTLFNYKKGARIPLIYKRIKKVLHIAGGGAIIEVDGIASRFKTLFAPTIEQKYAGLLQLKNTHILYGLYDQEYSATTRAV